MARVLLFTAAAVYRGELRLETPGGQPVRFLDAVRAPQRIGHAAVGAAPSLELHQASVESRFGGPRQELPGVVHVRPSAVIAACDLDPGTPSAGGTLYEKRAPGGAIRVLLHLDGRLELEGTVIAGIRSLDALRGDTFVACTSTVLRQTNGGPSAQFPFLAVNTSRIESICVLEKAGAGAAE